MCILPIVCFLFYFSFRAVFIIYYSYTPLLREFRNTAVKPLSVLNLSIYTVLLFFCFSTYCRKNCSFLYLFLYVVHPHSRKLCFSPSKVDVWADSFFSSVLGFSINLLSCLSSCSHRSSSFFVIIILVVLSFVKIG